MITRVFLMLTVALTACGPTTRINAKLEARRSLEALQIEMFGVVCYDNYMGGKYAECTANTAKGVLLLKCNANRGCQIDKESLR